MSSSASLLPFTVSSSSSSSSSSIASLLPSSTPLCFSQPRLISTSATFKQHRFSFPSVKGRRKFPTLPFSSTKRFLVRAAEYKFPDPIPEFADAVSCLFHFCFSSLYFLTNKLTSFSNFFLFVVCLFQETEKFKSHLLQKLTKKDIYGESVEEIVGICTEVRWFPSSCPLLPPFFFR